MKISNFQAKVSDFSDDLISLNKNLVFDKVVKTESIIKNRIKDFKEALRYHLGGTKDLVDDYIEEIEGTLTEVASHYPKWLEQRKLSLAN